MPADDLGAGKTILAGLLTKEMTAAIRSDASSFALAVSPKQWQVELYRRFHLKFDIPRTTSSKPR